MLGRVWALKAGGVKWEPCMAVILQHSKGDTVKKILFTENAN